MAGVEGLGCNLVRFTYFFFAVEALLYFFLFEYRNFWTIERRTDVNLLKLHGSTGCTELQCDSTALYHEKSRICVVYAPVITLLIEKFEQC